MRCSHAELFERAAVSIPMSRDIMIMLTINCIEYGKKKRKKERKGHMGFSIVAIHTNITVPRSTHLCTAEIFDVTTVILQQDIYDQFKAVLHLYLVYYA